MSRPMGLLEQARDVDDMLSELKTEVDYRAVVRLAAGPSHTKLTDISTGSRNAADRLDLAEEHPDNLLFPSHLQDRGAHTEDARRASGE